MLFAGAACSSSASSTPEGWTPGTATLDSTFTSMPAYSWASAAVSQAADSELSISVANLAGGTDSCLAARVGSTAANTVRVVIALSSNQMLAPGKYVLGNGWQASYARADGACATAEQGVAVKGTLEIDSVDGAVRGVADVTFPAGRIIAAFAAGSCGPVPGGASACTTFPVCPAGQGADTTPPADACLASP
jgi:hypothetical protein